MSILSFWIASWGVASLGHIFKIHLFESLSHWPLVRLVHLCTPCTNHPFSNCSENLPGGKEEVNSPCNLPGGSSFHHLLFEYAIRSSVLLFKSSRNVVCFMFCSWTVVKTCPISQFMDRSSVHRLLSRTILSFNFICQAMRAVQCKSSMPARVS
jgi:hypothetical protein